MFGSNNLYHLTKYGCYENDEINDINNDIEYFENNIQKYIFVKVKIHKISLIDYMSNDYLSYRFDNYNILTDDSKSKVICIDDYRLNYITGIYYENIKDNDEMLITIYTKDIIIHANNKTSLKSFINYKKEKIIYHSINPIPLHINNNFSFNIVIKFTIEKSINDFKNNFYILGYLKKN